MSKPALPDDWNEVLHAELSKPYFQELQRFLLAERSHGPVYPPAADVFTAFAHTPYASTRVVILGQDPYHGEGQAQGLAFSVRPDVALPPSLGNIFKELKTDVGVEPGPDGSLLGWADQGVLLLNTVLTVRKSEPGSHQKRGWETFTDAVLRALAKKPHPVIFVLWGKHAQKKTTLLEPRHHVLAAPHPSPLSAHAGFFGSRPFSRVNAVLRTQGDAEINWSHTP